MSEPLAFVVVQFLAGLASASDLFLVASGLSIIFGVTRIVNFAHGSLYMLGAYLAWSAVRAFGTGPLGFWGGVAVAALAVMAFGILVEMTLLRRIYRAPELFQLLATFAVVLIVQDLVVLTWGPEDRLGPRAPGFDGSVTILGQRFPEYDLLLIALGLAVLVLLTLLFKRTRWGILVRAATDDREMVAALGVHQRWLFTSVFALGALLAGLGGALQVPRVPVHASMDLQVIVEAFVVVVVGGLGSVSGAYLAAVLIGVLNAFGIAIFPQISLVLAFLVMAFVLAVRPHGLLGRPQAGGRPAGAAAAPMLVPAGPRGRAAAALIVAVFAAMPLVVGDYSLAVLTEVLIFAIFAASLNLLLGPAGLISFGHAAYFGVGAYGAALMITRLGLPFAGAVAAGILAGVLAAAACAAVCLRLSGVYLAMLTLAFAQIVWSIAFQWYDVTGGDNGILGVWPPAWLSSASAFYGMTLAIAAIVFAGLRHLVFSPFGLALRGCRDHPVRAEAVGLSPQRLRFIAFTVAGGLAGLAGSLHAVFKGSVFPDTLAIPLSVEGLVMVLIGGINTLTGPVVGAAVYKLLHILLTSYADSWRLVMGCLIATVVVAFPEGIVGGVQRRLAGDGGSGRR
jgi:branched-chain amino acid transport system permease protein